MQNMRGSKNNKEKRKQNIYSKNATERPIWLYIIRYSGPNLTAVTKGSQILLGHYLHFQQRYICISTNAQKQRSESSRNIPTKCSCATQCAIHNACTKRQSTRALSGWNGANSHKVQSPDKVNNSTRIKLAKCTNIMSIMKDHKQEKNKEKQNKDARTPDTRPRRSRWWP